MDGRSVSITVDVRLEGESPIGRVRDGPGREREFAGWMGLVAAIDELLSAAAGREMTERAGGA